MMETIIEKEPTDWGKRIKLAQTESS